MPEEVRPIEISATQPSARHFVGSSGLWRLRLRFLYSYRSNGQVAPSCSTSNDSPTMAGDDPAQLGTPRSEAFVKLPDVYLDGPTGMDGSGYAANCIVPSLTGSCFTPSAEKIGTGARSIPLPFGFNKRIPDTPDNDFRSIYQSYCTRTY